MKKKDQRSARCLSWVATMLYVLVGQFFRPFCFLTSSKGNGRMGTAFGGPKRPVATPNSVEPPGNPKSWSLHSEMSLKAVVVLCVERVDVQKAEHRRQLLLQSQTSIKSLERVEIPVRFIVLDRYSYVWYLYSPLLSSSNDSRRLEFPRAEQN